MFLPIATKMYFRNKLTDCSGFALADGFHDTDAAAGLEGGLEPVGGVLHIGHIDPQTSILTQEDHRRPLLVVARRVTYRHHILNLQNKSTKM